MLENIENFGVYVLYDDCTEKYGLPFVAINKEEAIRSCVSEFLSIDNNVLTDMRLYEIGQFYHDDGTIEGYPSDSHFLVCDSDELIKKIIQVRTDLDAIRKEAYAELEEFKKIRENMNKSMEDK